jgi:hypothetical protein
MSIPLLKFESRFQEEATIATWSLFNHHADQEEMPHSKEEWIRVEEKRRPLNHLISFGNVSLYIVICIHSNLKQVVCVFPKGILTRPLLLNQQWLLSREFKHVTHSTGVFEQYCFHPLLTCIYLSFCRKRLSGRLLIQLIFDKNKEKDFPRKDCFWRMFSIKPWMSSEISHSLE